MVASYLEFRGWICEDTRCNGMSVAVLLRQCEMAKQELLATIRDRYRASSKREKSRILHEFIAVTGHHRKHGIRLLGQSGGDGEQQPAVKKGRRIYDEAVRQALIVVSEAADRISGKRLKAALPHLVESMERHGHLDLDPRVRQRLLAASAATGFPGD